MAEVCGEQSFGNEVKDWVQSLQASIETAGLKTIEDMESLQMERSRMRFIRNNSLHVLINNHFGFIEIEVKISERSINFSFKMNLYSDTYLRSNLF